MLQYVFMNLETYEETRLGRDESWAKYLKEGFTVALVVWNDKVRPPANTNIPSTQHVSSVRVSVCNSLAKSSHLHSAMYDPLH